MIDVIDLAGYKNLSAKEKQMKTQTTVTPNGSITTRLIAGVELKLVEMGKKWTLTVQPEKAK